MFKHYAVRESDNALNLRAIRFLGGIITLGSVSHRVVGVQTTEIKLCSFHL